MCRIDRGEIVYQPSFERYQRELKEFEDSKPDLSPGSADCQRWMYLYDMLRSACPDHQIVDDCGIGRCIHCQLSII
jgi:hypothetical protein